MDPQKLASLDPKLREAYQRVMGTPIPQPQVVPIQAQTPPMPPPMPDPTPTPQPKPKPEPEPIPPPAAPTIQEPPVSQPQPAIPQPEPIPNPQPAISQQPPVQPTNFDQMNSEVPASMTQNFTTPAPMAAVQTMAIKKKKGMMMPILFGIAGLIVIAVYTLFWAKIFNFKLPFLH